MRILFCSERFIFRYGLDRVLMILADELHRRGHEVTMMAQSLDRPVLETFARRIIVAPQTTGPIHARNAEIASWLGDAWSCLFDGEAPFDAAVCGGWPFFAAIPFLRSKCPFVVFSDHGCVPLDGYAGAQLEAQLQVRQERRAFVGESSIVVAVSRFIRDSQSRPDAAGRCPTTFILNGANHLNSPLWTSNHLAQTAKDTTAADVAKGYKRAGLRTILNLGRWEPGCYKNSEAVFDIARELAEDIFNLCFLILADPSHVKIPSSLEGVIRPIGFPDDVALAKIMTSVDAGICTSRWEGFNLPLAEMQWVSRPAFVFEVGAHPEVVVDPYFLCQSNSDMVRKLRALLIENAPPEDELQAGYQNFRSAFDWQGVIDQYEQLLARLNDPPCMADK